jgi:curved DNA-binding protein
MQREPDYYKILQVHPTAEPEVIEAAYRRLARKYHPDVNRDPAAAQRMRDLNEAYELLSNPVDRASYDEWRAHLAQGQQHSYYEAQVHNTETVSQREAKPTGGLDRH